MRDLDVSELHALVAGQGSILLLLDFDGTLSEIAPRPEQAIIAPGNRDLLRQLADRSEFTVGVISGRSLHDVEARVNVAGLVYAGNHGLEIRGLDLDYRHPDADTASRNINQAAHELELRLAGVPGALVENKTYTLTAHFRQTPPYYHDQVVDAFADITRPLVQSGSCHVTEAKMALELRPSIDWNKGSALTLIRSRLAPSSFAIYIGDDATDEDAFAAVQAAGGLGVYVGPSDACTSADWRLASPTDVSTSLVEMVTLEPSAIARNEPSP